ncbi:MAG: RNA polymerase sigma factor [Clostridia bacterium]|nr:RNA polymerase sigma factor [Clostridia bacterium]
MDIEKEKIGKLIEQIQSGSNEAFEDLYRLTSPKAYFVALQILKNEQDAEDILQETYIKVLEKIGEIDPSQSFMGWLYRVVSNKSKNLLKKRNVLAFESYEDETFEEIPDDGTEFSPEENLDQGETCREVMAAIDELSDEKRVCIIMKYFGEMTVSEIAESLEVPESTVKNRLYSARKDLKTKFEKNGNVLYGVALGGVLIWALGKTSTTASAVFLASAASAEIVAGATAATTATASGVTTAAATGTGIAAKAAALSVAQKVAIGIAATAVVGGSTAGVVTVVRNNNQAETTAYVEESTTAPTQKAEEIINRITAPAEISTEPSTKFSFNITFPSKKPYTTTPKTSAPSTTAKQTTVPPTSTTIAETTTEIITTTVVTTTQPQTTQPTTLAQATLIIEVTDFDDNVVDTLHLNVEAGTEMTWDYLITLVSQNGYEAMAGIYGDGVGAVAQAGETYTFTAEL